MQRPAITTACIAVVIAWSACRYHGVEPSISRSTMVPPGVACAVSAHFYDSVRGRSGSGSASGAWYRRVQRTRAVRGLRAVADSPDFTLSARGRVTAIARWKSFVTCTLCLSFEIRPVIDRTGDHGPRYRGGPRLLTLPALTQCTSSVLRFATPTGPSAPRRASRARQHSLFARCCLHLRGRPSM